ARRGRDAEDDRAVDLGRELPHERLVGWIGDRDHEPALGREPDRQRHQRLAELPRHHRGRVAVDVDSVQVQVWHAGLLGEHAREILLEHVAEPNEGLAEQLTLLGALRERPVELLRRNETLVEQDRAELWTHLALEKGVVKPRRSHVGVIVLRSTFLERGTGDLFGAQAAATARGESTSSAIWIAFNAAPFRRLSQARKRASPFRSAARAGRIRPTSTSLAPAASRGLGNSTRRTLGASASTRSACSGESGSTVSIQIDSAWPTITGTRTQVALIGRSGSSMIFRDSSRIFVS